MNAIEQLRQRLLANDTYNVPLRVIPPAFSHNSEKRLDEMRKLRLRLEEQNQNRTKPFEQILLDHDFRQKIEQKPMDPVQGTLQEIDKLISDYLKSGLRDQLYLNNLYRLRNDYLKKVTYGNAQQYYVSGAAPTQSNRFIIRNHQHTQSSQQHHLPTHQSDQQPQQYSNSLFSNQSLPFINKIRQRTEASDSQAMALQYFRNEEDQAYRSNSEDKLKLIHKIKHTIEDDIIRERAVNMAQRINFQYKEEDDELVVPYSQLEGIFVRWDFVSRLPININRTRLAYGVFNKEDEYHPFKQTTDQNAIEETFRSNKSVFREKELLRDIKPAEDAVLYIELWAFISEQVPECVGWTLFKFFDHTGGLLVGKYKLPFYSKQYKPNNLLNGAVYPYIGNLCLYMRILQPSNNLHDDQVYVENDYKVPLYHAHRQHKIFRSEAKELPKVDLGFDKPLKERAPELFAEAPPPPEQPSVEKIESQQVIKPISLGSKASIFVRPPELGARSPGTNVHSEVSKKPGSTRRSIWNRRLKNQEALLSPDKPITIGALTTQEQKDQISMTRIPIPSRDQTPQTKRAGVLPTPQSIRTKKHEHTAAFFGKLMIYVNKLKSFAAGGMLEIKLGIFEGSEFVIDQEGRECSIKQPLIPLEVEERMQRFDYYCEFNLDFARLQQVGQAIVYWAFYKDRELFGWNVVEVFRKGQSYNRVNSGRYTVNLLKPPAQQVPFDESKMKKSNIQLEFILMANNEHIGDLDEINLYEIQSEATVRMRKAHWNTQILLTLNELHYFPSKEKCMIIVYKIKVQVLNDGQLIEDILDRACTIEGDLEAFSTKDSSLLSTGYYACFRIGKPYLTERYRNVAMMNYVLTVFYENNVLGIGQLAVFKKDTLQLGSYRLNLYNVNTKKTKFMVSLSIKETPLILEQLDQLEQVLDDQQKQKQSKLDQEKASQTKDKQAADTMSKYQVVTISVNHVQIESTLIKLYITNGKYVQLNDQAQECLVEFTKPQKSVFNIPIQNMLQTMKSQDDHQLIAEIYLEQELTAWIAVNLFFGQKLYTTKLFTELFKPPLLKPPVDFRLVKKLRTKIELQIDLGDKTREAPKRSTLKKTSTSITIFSISNLPSDGTFNMSIEIRTDQKIVQDRQLHPCASKLEVTTQKGSIKESTFVYQLLKTEIPENAKLLIYLDKDGLESRWCSVDIYQNGQPIAGRLDKKMLFPPFQKPPFSKTVKVAPTDISLEID